VVFDAATREVAGRAVQGQGFHRHRAALHHVQPAVKADRAASLGHDATALHTVPERAVPGEIPVLGDHQRRTGVAGAAVVDEGAELAGRVEPGREDRRRMGVDREGRPAGARD